MGKALVTLINPNKVHPGITPYALDILTTSLEQNQFDVEVIDLTFEREHWRELLARYFAEREPLLIGCTIRNTDTIYPQEQRVFLAEHREIIAAVRALSDAPIVCGGVGFSSMPFALVDYFGVDYAVKGPGELILSQLADNLYHSRSPYTVIGLIINESGKIIQVDSDTPRLLTGRADRVNRVTAYNRRSGVPWRVDNREYYRRGGLSNIITKNGCSFSCTHCVEPDAKGNQFAKRSYRSVVDEIEALASQGVRDIHTTDSEVNLSLGHIKKILREIISRKAADRESPLHGMRLWMYCQPVPFDEEFADLLRLAGCAGVNFGSDHTCDDMLKSWKVTANGARFYTYEHIKRANQLVVDRGMLVMHDILLGMPGETIDTVYQCIDETLALDATVIGYTLGIRIFPYSPLGVRFAAESDGERTIPGLQSNTAVGPILLKPVEACESRVQYERQFMFDEHGRFRPVYYFSPELPESAETLRGPSRQWARTVELMWDYIAKEDHHRVMLPTLPGLSKDDNNYADNPFLTALVELGYKGAFWARWRERDEIIEQARVRRSVPRASQSQKLRAASLSMSQLAGG
ncbi:MAG: tryptophan 2-C-methyltransferase [Proteobacteria bacterium]|nr:tryptophan 2-C-methyltransferase [Pseudomonadota bacterium]